MAPPQTTDQLFTEIYNQLHTLATQYLHHEHKNHILQPTALVHEAYLKISQNHIHWQNQTHILAIAAQAMRRILLDYARQTNTTKRGGGQHRIKLHDNLITTPNHPIDHQELENALTKLTKHNPHQAKIIELRFYSGLTVQQVAKILGMPKRSLEREWTTIRNWLQQELTHNMIRKHQSLPQTRGTKS
jgi:RNA polymerase sigma factor (TIGR02999 family)